MWLVQGLFKWYKLSQSDYNIDPIWKAWLEGIYPKELVNNIRVLVIVHWSLTALSMAIVQHFGTIWIHSWMRFSWCGRFWMNYWLTEQSVFLYLVELVNFSSDLSFWLSSLWPSAFSASYFSCDFFFFTMRMVRRSRRVKAATAPMTIGRRRFISAPKASCLCKKWPRHFGAATNRELKLQISLD